MHVYVQSRSNGTAVYSCNINKKKRNLKEDEQEGDAAEYSTLREKLGARGGGHGGGCQTVSQEGVPDNAVCVCNPLNSVCNAHNNAHSCKKH